MEKYHEPVLINEVIAHLKPTKNKKYIDCTLGDGGHTLELLKKGADVLGIDYNNESLNRATQRIINNINPNSGKFTPKLGNFKNIEEIVKNTEFTQVDGILFDLGYSSSQLTDSHGLSFIENQPLDMRLDKTLGVTAADLVNSLSENQLSHLIYEFSDEKLAKKFAKEIVKHRSLKKFQTTSDLADLLKSVSPSGYENGRIHPATRTFQALRIAVNDELNNLKFSLPRAARLLLPGGRMLVISFHSLEDKLVKQFGLGAQPFLKTLVDKPITPSDSEIDQNVRSRSAKLRVFEKI